jgi:hypothetical protein
MSPRARRLGRKRVLTRTVPLQTKLIRSWLAGLIPSAGCEASTGVLGFQRNARRLQRLFRAGAAVQMKTIGRGRC